MNKQILSGTLFAGTAVILGAFAAHALKARLAAEQLQAFETGVRYQMYHAFALIALGILSATFRNRWMKYAGIAFISGILLFSGSLYLLTLGKLISTDGWRWPGPFTPLGGLALISGWVLMGIGVVKRKNE